jgi:hypothetical protein
MGRVWKVRTEINSKGAMIKGFCRMYIEYNVEMSINQRKLEEGHRG